jgi:hypothetical protein
MTKLATGTSIRAIGHDIAKNSFSVHGFDGGGNTVLEKAMKRGQVLAFSNPSQNSSEHPWPTKPHFRRRIPKRQTIRSLRHGFRVAGAVADCVDDDFAIGRLIKNQKGIRAGCHAPQP